MKRLLALILALALLLPVLAFAEEEGEDEEFEIVEITEDEYDRIVRELAERNEE